MAGGTLNLGNMLTSSGGLNFGGSNNTTDPAKLLTSLISGTGGTFGTALPATTSSKTSTNNQTASSSSANQGTTNTATQQSSNKKNIDDESLRALQVAIAQLASGGEGTLLGALDTARSQGITTTQGIINTQSPEEAAQRASGRTADLARNLREGAIADLIGSTESSGFGGNALAQLRAQDAAIRTGEAQARIEEEARNAAVQNQLTGTQVLNQLLGGGSAVQDQLVSLLNVAKGATESGTQNTTGATSTNEAATTQSTTEGTSNESASGSDPVNWANLLTQLAIAGLNQPQQASDIEKALAIFQAGGGSLTSLGNPQVGTSGIGASTALAQNNALSTILSLLQGA